MNFLLFLFFLVVAAAAQNCPPGKSESSDTAPPTCDDCEKGMYNTEEGAVACKSCPAGFSGTVTSSEGSPVNKSAILAHTMCEQCVAGMYAEPRYFVNTLWRNPERCVGCSEGKTSSEDRGLCVECATGQYAGG